ncbi:branched-chain amino acid aminotransferase [Halalkalibaculum sp. DA3122]|uniref:branched-chain amino acid aminotransferase n=1 Tax=unclassified Halalkalibaculum TaxID=2964617 RepID=UPI00375485EB
MKQSSAKTFAKQTDTDTNSSKILLQLRSSSRVNEVDLDHPGFGDLFSDHMFSLQYADGEWQDARIIPFEDLKVSPAMSTLHYGQTVFEGMKAFRGKDGEIRFFRMDRHLDRLNTSCERMCIPQVDTGLLKRALKKLVSIDKEWVPEKHGNALYIRPLAFATDACLGVRPAEHYRLLIMTSPVGAYYKEGFDPVSLTTSDDYIRGAKGGTGFIKTACNYGPTLLPAQKAKQKGFTQIIWLDAKEHKYIEEVGTMNIFFKIDGELHTPPLNGSILGGITRDSVIKLAEHWNIPVHERPITIDEIFEADKNKTLEEVFGTGTAAVISPVGSIHHQGNTLVTDENEIGPFAKKLFDTITGIQYSTHEDIYHWMSTIS